MRKKLISLALVTATFALTAAAQFNPFPWDFPQDITIVAEPGQYVLSPYSMYKGAVEDEENLLKKTLIFYSTKMTEVGTQKSIVDFDVEVPNALIIPLDKNARAKKGDIVLTWWQSGSGIERAIVVDDSDPTAPKVDYLDMNYKDDPDNPGFAQRFANDPIKPGTFTVLTNGKWEPGAQVACKNSYGQWNAGTLIHEKDGKVLVIGFSSKVIAYNKEDVKLIPFKEDIKVGDEVFAVSVSSYDSGYTVTKIDQSIGRVWVEKRGSTQVVSICEVTKVLE